MMAPSIARAAFKYEGEIWLVERPVVTLQTATPMTQWGIWDCALAASEHLRLGRELRCLAGREAQERVWF